MADMVATRESYGKVLAELAADKNVVVLDADLSGSTQSKKFKEVCPERFFNMGIAESDLAGVACGMALSGKIVFASSFSMFLTGRAFEIIRNSIGYSHANVKLCGTHAGVTVGEDGATHQALEDLAAMSSIPGMTVLNPADDVSARKLIKAAAYTDGPFYIRLGRSKVPTIYSEDQEFEIGKAVQLRDGNDCTIIAAGIMVSKAAEAAEKLAEQGICTRVLDMHSIKPIDEEAVIKAAKETGHIVVCEEHSIYGGLGSIVARLTAQRCPCRIEYIAVMDKFGESGKPDELLEKFGLTSGDIEAAVKNCLK